MEKKTPSTIALALGDYQKKLVLYIEKTLVCIQNIENMYCIPAQPDDSP